MEQVRDLKSRLAPLLLGSSQQATISSSLLPRKKLGFGVKELDRMLGGGLPFNSIIELFGAAGTGKTQLCISLVAQFLLKEPDVKVLYISTQERFAIERLVEMLGTEARSETLDRLHLEYFLDSDVEQHFIRFGLLELVKEFGYGLIVYDGIASNARIIQDTFEKTSHISMIFASLRQLFAYSDLCVVVTNQITDVPGELDSTQKSALGLALSNCINLKICLEADRGRKTRRFTLVKSVFTPLDSEYFTIDGAGIKGSSAADDEVP